MPNRKVVSKIRYLRDQSGLTQADLAELLDVDKNTIANWERGRVSLSWFQHVDRLCRIFGCHTSELYEEFSLDEFKEKQKQKKRSLDYYRSLLGTEIPSNIEQARDFSE